MYCGRSTILLADAAREAGVMARGPGLRRRRPHTTVRAQLRRLTCDGVAMSNDYDRIRNGIEFMTAYVSGNELLTQYVVERRREDPEAVETLMDGAAALCALLLHKMARETGKSEHELLQELATVSYRREQQADD